MQSVPGLPDRPMSTVQDLRAPEPVPGSPSREAAASQLLFPGRPESNPSELLLSEVAQLNASYSILRRSRTSDAAQCLRMNGASSRAGQSPLPAPAPGHDSPREDQSEELSPKNSPQPPDAPWSPHVSGEQPQPGSLPQSLTPHVAHTLHAAHARHSGPRHPGSGGEAASPEALPGAGDSRRSSAEKLRPPAGPQHQLAQAQEQRLDLYSTPDATASPAPSPGPMSQTEIDRMMLAVREKQKQARSPQPAADDDDDEPGRSRRRKCHFDGCNMYFKQKAHLETHLRSHTGERPYACPFPQCGKTFSQQCNLRAHVRAHTGERPYKCKVCGRGFSQQGNMRHHMLVHYNDHPIECRLDGCPRRFNQLGNLKAHQNSAHKDTLHAFTEKLKNSASVDEMGPEERELFDHFCTLYKNANKGIRGRGKGTKSLSSSRRDASSLAFSIDALSKDLPPPQSDSPEGSHGSSQGSTQGSDTQPHLATPPPLAAQSAPGIVPTTPVPYNPADPVTFTPAEPYPTQLADAPPKVPKAPLSMSQHQQPPVPAPQLDQTQPFYHNHSQQTQTQQQQPTSMAMSHQPLQHVVPQAFGPPSEPPPQPMHQQQPVPQQSMPQQPMPQQPMPQQPMPQQPMPQQPMTQQPVPQQPVQQNLPAVHRAADLVQQHQTHQQQSHLGQQQGPQSIPSSHLTLHPQTQAMPVGFSPPPAPSYVPSPWDTRNMVAGDRYAPSVAMMYPEPATAYQYPMPQAQGYQPPFTYSSGS